jgi:hypothetical protein
MTYEDMDRIVSKYKDFFKIPKLEKPHRDDINKQYVNPKSNSGFFSSLFFGSNKKESGWISNYLATILYERTKSRPTVDTSLRTFGGRERLIDSYGKIGEKGRSRCVIREEACISQFKHLYARALTEAYKKINVNWGSSHGIGGLLHGRGWFEFKKRFNVKNTKVLVGDFERHDQRVKDKTLIYSYGRLRSSFPKSRVIDNHFFFFF